VWTSSQFWLWEGINGIYSLIFQSRTGWFLNIHPVVSFFLPGGMSLRIGDVDSSIAFSDGDFFYGVLTFLVLLQKNTKTPAQVF
jgi:hypothetical protein